MVKIKMCGLTRAEDVITASALGVDAIGLVFYPPSPRYVTAKKAAELLKSCAPFTTSVALFVDELAENVVQVLQQVSIDLLQFHGNETAAYCEQFTRPYIKAIKIAPHEKDASHLSEVLCEAIASHPKAKGFLLDALVAGEAGGTGHSLSWASLATALDDGAVKQALVGRYVLVAGGLNPENCAVCAEQLKPYAVDVSSGIESSRGVKDRSKMERFVGAISDLRTT